MSDNIEIGLLHQVLRYEPDTGKLFWLERPSSMFPNGHGRYTADRNAAIWNSRYSGREAFTAKVAGYPHGHIFGRPYRAHRVAWALHHGAWPSDQIDHANGIRHDNRIANLRAVANGDNARNVKRLRTNTSGVTGVVWLKRERRWLAQVVFKGQQIYIGTFINFEDAVAARKAAEAKHGFHPNHGRAA